MNFFCEKTFLFGLFYLQTSQFGRSYRENPLSQKSGKWYILLFGNDIYMIVYHFLGHDIDTI
jgi:hypothetical protein